MNTTVATARTELRDRGFAGWTDARLDRFLAAGVRRILTVQENWPFLIAATTTTEGTAITGAGTILEVRRDSISGFPLPHRRREELIHLGVDVELAGTATCWYAISVDDTGIAVQTQPREVGGALWVRHYYDPAQATMGTLVTFWVLIPDIFEDVILDAATLEAAKDAGDWERVRGLREDIGAASDPESRWGRLIGRFHDQQLGEHNFVIGIMED